MSDVNTLIKLAKLRGSQNALKIELRDKRKELYNLTLQIGQLLDRNAEDKLK
jgi:hypothetical protein